MVKTLENRRGTIVEAGVNGRYRVRVEGITIWCRAEDLEAAGQAGRNRKGTRTTLERQRLPASKSPEIRQGAHRAGHGAHGGHDGRLDLHGLRVEEALARVDEEIDRALIRGADRLEIVHGRGTGRIRNALHRHLASMTAVAAFRLDAGNPGVTWVHF